MRQTLGNRGTTAKINRQGKEMECLTQHVLRTNEAGVPLEWINYQTAVKFHCLGHIAYSLGTPLYVIHGGVNARSGQRSEIAVNSIIATHSSHFRRTMQRDYQPPLNNHTLFQRDNHLCLYCGKHWRHSDLSRDHVTPISQGGEDCWSNVVTACRRCNNYKADATPEQAGMELLAIPFIPNHAEYVFLQGRRILADQMAFLRAHFPRKSPLHQRS